MNLERVNSHLLSQICIRLNLPPHSEINSSFCEGVCRKLNFNCRREDCSCADVVTGLGRLGLDLSHVNLDKLDLGDELHTYLLLDILSVLLDSKSSATSENIKRLLHKNQAKDTPRVLSVEEDKGGTTSGGEEVSKILQQAERKYGHVKSFRKAVDKENISAIDNAPVVDTKKWGKENISVIEKDPVIDGETWEKEKEYRKNTLIGKTKDNEFKRKIKAIDESQFKKGKTNIISKGEKSKNTMEVDGIGPVDTVLEASDDVTIKIPQSDGADVVVKVKSLEGKSLKSRRIHVKINDESITTPKRIRYGRKAVLAHHLRKTRSPMFSKKPKPIAPSKREVMEKVAVEVRKKRKQDEIQQEDIKVTKNIRDTKTSIQCKLSAQRFVRENRTRTAQLRKLASNLPT